MIGHYLNTFALTSPFLPPWLKGLAIAFLGSTFLYLSHYGLEEPIVHTVLALGWLILLLPQNKTVWFWQGFFQSIAWFWWIALSFFHYKMPYLIPLVILAIGTIYGAAFYLVCLASDKLGALLRKDNFSLFFRAIGLSLLHLFHPFGFDWFKPELILVHSFFGVDTWRFLTVAVVAALTLGTKRPYWLVSLILAYQPLPRHDTLPKLSVALISTHTDVEEKWDPSFHKEQFEGYFKLIERAIADNKKVAVLPESTFPVFINYDQDLFNRLLGYARRITIVTGGLYLDDKTPKNATYIFYPSGKVTVAHKAVLVPFGEANPLPDFLGKWINTVFYDGAIDYHAAREPADYRIEKVTFRNAICYEATSQKLYDPPPKYMIVLSNNAWFTPSIQPTLQRLLLFYYHRKYGTAYLHAINGSPSYRIDGGKTLFESDMLQ